LREDAPLVLGASFLAILRIGISLRFLLREKGGDGDKEQDKDEEKPQK
jgi:hypothetical protein